MAENNLGGQKVLLLPEGSDRLLGRDAQRSNIAVAIAVANAVKTTLGPKGMDKMLVSDLGDITITNDGATILEEMNVEHPVAKIMVDVAKTQDNEVGDGTTSVIIMAGSFLKGADDLIEQGIHPTIIVRGYKMAAEKSESILDSISKPIDVNNKELLEKIGMVAEGSKNIGNEDTKRHITEITIDAIKQVMTKSEEGKTVVDKDFIKIEKKSGASVANTELIKGVLIDKEVAHPQMPKKVVDAKIALLDVALEIEKTETDARIEITSPDQMQSFLEQEEKMLKTMVDKIVKSGANVVFTQKGIDDVAQHYMAKSGILAARRIKRSDMEKIAKATNAKMVTSLDDLSESDLGKAGLVEERKISGEEMIFVEKCLDPKSVTIFIRGGSQQVIDEVERSITDLIGALSTVVEDGRFVVGGGAVETEVAEQLRNYSGEIGGREQLAIQKFADALEQIPEVLAQSAGMDPIDTIVNIRSRHKSDDGKSYGVDVYKGAVGDMLKEGVLEPTKMKVQEIYSASEAAEMILRIDDMISSRSKGGQGTPQGGMGEPME